MRVHPFSWTVICSSVLENARKTAAMHNSVKKTFKTRNDEGESPSISPQVTVRLFSSTREPVDSVKPGTHYKPTVRLIMNVIWAQAVFSVGVQSRLVCGV